MIGRVGLIYFYDLMEYFDASDYVCFVYHILVLPGLFFVFVLIKDGIVCLWKRHQCRAWYQKINPKIPHKYRKTYLIRRKEQVRNIRENKTRKWKKRKRNKRVCCIGLALLLFLFLTENYPSNQKEHRIDDIKETQAVFMIWHNVSGCFGADSCVIAIDKNGKWKEVSIYSDIFQRLAKQEGVAYDDGDVECTPRLLDAILEAEEVPYESHRFVISKRGLENAINNDQYFGLVNDYSLYWLMPVVDKDSYHYKTVGGNGERKIHKVGMTGYYNGFVAKADISPLYLIFLQIELWDMDFYSFIENRYIQGVLTILISICIIRGLYPILRKSSR